MNHPDRNPFQSLEGSRAAVPAAESTKKLNSVAKARRLANVAISLYTLVILIHVITKIGTNGHTQLPFGILIFSMFAAGRLAYALHGTWNALFYCLAMLVPGVGFILLVLLNSRATTLLKTDGSKVGLWGADLGPLPSPH